MSVIRFELPARQKREVWECKCDKCQNQAASAGRHRQVRQRKSLERNVVSLSSWLSEPKRLRLPAAE
jgi:ribosomal protein L37AE/L43A